MAGSAASPRFLNDDPIQVQPDTRDAAGIKADEVSLFVDLAYNLISGAGPARGRAGNLNSVDEVPDSSWYTNRAGARPLTAAEIAIGPDTTSGPAGGSWTITSSKSDGVTPGFTVKDTAGRRWFLKFDPPGYGGMATGTEVAVTKLMWALGYNVAENHIAYLRREQLAIGATATFTPKSGRKRPMRPGDVDALLADVDREADGTYRVRLRIRREAVFGNQFGNWTPGNQFHADVQATIRFIDIVDGADRRVIQRRRQPGLTDEAGAGRRIVERTDRKHFERDLARQLRIVRAIHLTHSACAQQAEHFVRTEACAFCEGHGSVEPSGIMHRQALRK